jgi:hypothetical protein
MLRCALLQQATASPQESGVRGVAACILVSCSDKLAATSSFPCAPAADAPGTTTTHSKKPPAPSSSPHVRRPRLPCTHCTHLEEILVCPLREFALLLRVSACPVPHVTPPRAVLRDAPALHGSPRLTAASSVPPHASAFWRHSTHSTAYPIPNTQYPVPSKPECQCRVSGQSPSPLSLSLHTTHSAHAHASTR